jgi:ribosomal peptide maturation radical SAM protein 1
MKNLEQLNNTKVKEKILSTLKGSDILLINPPFATIKNPKLGLHVLQTIAEKSGYKTDILYLNILLASIIGWDTAQMIAVTTLFSYWKMLGERLFARSAYGLPPLGKAPETSFNEAICSTGSKNRYVKTHYEEDIFDLETLKKIEHTCKFFIDLTVPLIASLGYKIVGCTAQFGQTNAAIAILNGVKQVRPDGGASCDPETAEGIASLSDSTNYIFSGDSELTFKKFLQGYSRGKLPADRIIWGNPLEDLDSLSFSDYDSYTNQFDAFLGTDGPKQTSISYETSRGCWWSLKHKCSFCGMRTEPYRQKKVKKVLDDLAQLNKRYPNRGVLMTDITMPLSNHKELIPALSRKEYSNMHYHYQITPNLSLKQLINLKAARLLLTPGIEALSTGLLKLLNKGVTARNNLYLLRNARSLGIYLYWHILWGIPGDKVSYYEDTLKLIPLIYHLQPPRELNHIQFERSSLYLKNPSHYRISNFHPLAVYNTIYPKWAKIDKLAWYFAAYYPCESHFHPGIIKELVKEWKLWKKMWKKTTLVMEPFMDFLMIYDTRNIDGKTKKHKMNYQQAREIMTTCIYKESESLDWALEEKLAVVVDSWYVPLVTASLELLSEFEDKHE